MVNRALCGAAPTLPTSEAPVCTACAAAYEALPSEGDAETHRALDGEAITRKVEALADKWDKGADGMSLVGGESPRPADFSEGHFVGVMKTLRAAASELRAAIADAEESTR
jgi:hypothetical protein